jgi:uncharacterized protein (TIGR02996 family)
MTHDDAFVESIVEAPDDDAPRLIYADWLEEHGDPDRAALIRVQIELAGLPEGDSRREELERREDELLTEHEGRWTAPLRAVLLEDVATPVFHRGFVEEMIFWGRAGTEALVAHANDLFRLAPLRALRLFPLGSHKTASEIPWNTRTNDLTDRLRTLDLEGLLWMSHLERVHLLDLSGHTLDNPNGGPAAIVNNHLGDYAANLLAEAASLIGLKTLLLRDNLIGDTGALALAQSPTLAGLTTLDLSHNRLSDETKSELRQRMGERLIVE